LEGLGTFGVILVDDVLVTCMVEVLELDGEKVGKTSLVCSI